MTVFSEDRSYSSISGCLASATATGGAMNAIVHLWFWMLAEELAEVEASHHHQPCARMQRGVEQHRHSVDVEERQHGEDHVLGDHPVQRPDLRDVRHQVAMRQHHALGVAGGS